MKKRIITLIEKIHLRFFGHEMGPEMRRFLTNLSWSFWGGSIYSILMLGISILAGRFLGPAEYGKYGLVLVINEFLFIAFFWGIDIASTRAIAKSADDEEKRKNISSATYFVLCTILISSVVALSFSKIIANILSTDIIVVVFAVVLSVFSAWKLILNSFIQGIHRFKIQFVSRMVEASVVCLAFFMVFFLLKSHIYSSYIMVLSLGSVGAIGIFAISLRNYFGRFDRTALLDQLSYGKLVVMSTILGTAFASIGRLIINRYMSVYELGIYLAYYSIAISIVSQFSQIFNNVFFPMIAKEINTNIIQKLEKIILIFFLPFLLFFIAVIAVTVFLYGSKYPLDLNLVITFGIFGIARLMLSTYNSMIPAFAKSVYKKYILRYNIIDFLTAAIYLILILLEKISLQAVIGVQVINTVAVVVMQRQLIKKSLVDLANDENALPMIPQAVE